MSVHSQRLPVERSQYRTSNPTAAESMINDMYVGYRPTVSGSTRNFTFDVSRTSAGGISLDHVEYSMNMTVDCDPFDYLMFIFPTAGNLSITSGDRETRLGAGDLALYPVGAPLGLRWSPVRLHILSMSMQAAERAAAEYSGDGDLHFVATTPVSPAMDQFWRSTVGFVAHQLEVPDSPLAEPLVQSQTLGLLGAAALRTFPNTTMTADYLPGPGRVGPAALRRAIAFVDTQAERPITLSDIAAAARVSPRALQYAFARHHDTSPLAYLRRVRLERAHRDLQAADPTAGTTVAAVAAHWGFHKPGNFSAAYQEVYGQPPSHTLRA